MHSRFRAADGTGVGPIERSLFSFIWKHSKRDQFILLLLTAGLFPLLYLTLELPKRIINDAISADQPFIDFWIWEFRQIEFLVLLCGLYLGSVLCHGLMKMRINTMKGILSERMLRRLRYTLIARVMRFPQAYLRRTSQGEMVSMITSEAEPMGGIMGDAISQPVLQAGQMITILSFLFLQSVWFGLAAIALIPLQAWLIPKLQRQINLHNKDRIKQVRKLAGEIGETASGAATLRVNNGWRYRRAQITSRLGELFGIRLIIYKKKFFMKFLNNFINHLTPFFFYLVGGILVIQGQVSVGALVAALAAYKDLSSPWKELLTYYNQVQDLSVRWHLIIERFEPSDMVEDPLFEGEPDEIPHLDGDIVLDRVTVRDPDGDSVLEDISLTIPAGSVAAIGALDREERLAVANLLSREVLPSSGRVRIGDRNISDLHQKVIAARIGVADLDPYVFEGNLGDNVVMPLKWHPNLDDNATDAEIAQYLHEAERSGNSTDLLNADWISPQAAGVSSSDDIGDWWLALMDGIGSGDALFRRGLDLVFDPDQHPELAKALVELRPRIAEKLREENLDDAIYPFDEDVYNPALPVAANLFFATPREPIDLHSEGAVEEFLSLINDPVLEEGLLRLSQDVVEMLNQTFGVDGTDHPLFRQLGLNAEVFSAKVDLVRKSREVGIDALSREEQLQMLTLPFEISAEQIGPAFSEDLRDEILALRKSQSREFRKRAIDRFAPLDPEEFAPGLSVLENAVFGMISESAGGKAENIRRIVAACLREHGLTRQVAELIYGIATGMGGSGLASVYKEPLSISRAAIKRPDILILDGALQFYDMDDRPGVIRNLRELLPGTTMIFIEETLPRPELFEHYFEIEHGRLKDSHIDESGEEDNAVSADLRAKMRALMNADLFAGLPRKQLRLLAFGARWFEVPTGTTIFRMGDAASDGAYLLLEGEAGLYFEPEDGAPQLIATAGPGTLVGELALIRKESRALTMTAHTDLKALRLGEQEFLAVVENDAATAYKILQVLAGYAGRPAGSDSGDKDKS